VQELELQALRAEVEARELEAGQLQEQVRDADLRLMEASGTVGTLSAKVEATASNRHAVLGASAQQIDAQVAALRRRMARMEWELAEKDEEIGALRRAARAGAQRVGEQQDELELLQRSHVARDRQVAQLAQDASRLQRHRAIGEWRERVQAQIQQETADTQLARDRRDMGERAGALDEEIATLRTFISRMEERCKAHAAELQRGQQRCDALALEERLCLSAARLGHETADEQRRSQLAEQRELEARIQEERARRAARAPQALAYDAMEAGASRHHAALAALTSCMREISHALQEPAFTTVGDVLDKAMEAFLKSWRDSGEAVPSVARVGPREFALAGVVARCELSEGGRLCVRARTGGLVFLGDFLRHLGPTAARGGAEDLAGAVVPTPPLAARSARRSPSPPAPARRALAAGQSAWGMPALVTPIAIGGAGTLLTV